MAKELTSAEKAFKQKIDAAVKRRADAVRAEREATRDIAAICVDAKAAGVQMAQLASWVKVLSKDDELKSVSRQAVDQMLAQHQGRPRAPRRKPSERRNGAGKIKMDAFA
jgi:hypothetical protein